MKVICVEKVRNLTLGKTYEVYINSIKDDDFICYWLTDDKGYVESYRTTFFKTPAELREYRINKILE
jgi:hypothetical protein